MSEPGLPGRDRASATSEPGLPGRDRASATSEPGRTWTCAQSHLFRGARLSLEEPGLEPGAAILRFGDDVRVAVELFRRDGGGSELVLPAYRTARGTDIAAGRWLVAEAAAHATEARILIRLPCNTRAREHP